MKLLADSSGNILDDEDLISALKDSKVTSAGIIIKFEQADKLEKEIEKIRNNYRPVAIRG